MNEYRHRLEKLLPLVDKPSRYIGGEIGEIRKEFRPGMIRFAMAFPEIYEIGSSHHGGEILYQIVNSREDMICERVFCPWKDMAEKLRENEIPLLSIESGTPLADFDVVGFSLEYELSYTNVLEMLDLARIPLRSADRGEEHPLIIAGGPSVFNPEPVADFFDLFVIGDGEEILPLLL
ncbi:MAG TPA: B12-binding domain-containing radical SAM protein, partial [candidate division Zixibacteria bacterium]|nr:B12-binding domain-containing radical SAM protein [candidate division Zixibacteria bacterium]